MTVDHLPTAMTCAGAQIVMTPRNDVPRRIELLPTGTFTLSSRSGGKGTVTATVTDPQAVIARSIATAAAGMLPIDFAHGLDNLGARDGRAAGWMTGLSVEGEKIIADVEWTVAGREALLSKEYRFISPTFYLSADGSQVTHIARAGLTNVPALPELKQVASAQDAPSPFSAMLETLAVKMGMPDDTDPILILKAAEAAVDQLGDANPEKRGTDAAEQRTGKLDESRPAKMQAVSEPDPLSVVLAKALNLPETASPNEIVTALLTRDAVTAGASAAAQSDKGELIPITAVASYMADAETERQAELIERKVTAAMQAGKLPPALEGWARDLCADDPKRLDRFLSGSPFNLGVPVHPKGVPPQLASASALSNDPADSITDQLGLPQGSLRK